MIVLLGGLIMEILIETMPQIILASRVLMYST